MDRCKLLANKLVNYSCKVRKGEKVLIQYSDADDYFIKCIVNEVFDVGAYPIVKCVNRRVQKSILTNGSDELFKLMEKYDMYMMQDMDAVIIVAGENNVFEYSSVPDENMSLYRRIYHNHTELRCSKKWVLLKYPTYGFAQSSGMGMEEFEDYFYNVCTLDYDKMCRAMDNLSDLMTKTDKVRIVAKDTDISFSIKDIPNIKCCGECNIPDGELYTAPVKNSIEGYITFNIPVLYNGVRHDNIRLEFEKGKIVKATSSDTDNLNKILDTDDGARYIGEFSFGVNPYITKPILDILFDEKMCYSIHMAVGCSYDDAPNGNKSAVHWDLIQSHSDEYGGGEIYFDDVLIRKNGLFIPTNLVDLNPENLLK